MKTIKLSKYFDVYSYLYEKTFDSFELHKRYGLIFGVPGFTTLLGDAQAMFKKVMPKNRTKVQEEIWKNLIEAPFYKGTTWVSSAPVSVAGSFTHEFNDTFLDLIKSTESLQLSVIKEQEKRWAELVPALNLKAENHKALLYCRLLSNAPSPKETMELSYMANHDFETMLDQLSSDSLSTCLLTDRARHVPGRVIELSKEFSWLYGDENGEN